jgi:uncharacterized membrane protein
MTLMILGLLLWTLVHWTPSLWPQLKTTWKNKLGNGGYQGSFALLVVTGIVLIVLGWRTTVPSHIYTPVVALKYVAMALIVFGFILMGMANYASRIKSRIRHPQLTGFMLWAMAHLLLNGDSRSVLVFSWLLIWALTEIVLINRREPNFQPPAMVSWVKESAGVLISLIVIAVVTWVHPYLSGRVVF